MERQKKCCLNYLCNWEDKGRRWAKWTKVIAYETRSTRPTVAFFGIFSTFFGLMVGIGQKNRSYDKFGSIFLPIVFFSLLVFDLIYTIINIFGFRFNLGPFWKIILKFSTYCKNCPTSMTYMMMAFNLVTFLKNSCLLNLASCCTSFSSRGSSTRSAARIGLQMTFISKRICKMSPN